MELVKIIESFGEHIEFVVCNGINCYGNLPGITFHIM